MRILQKLFFTLCLFFISFPVTAQKNNFAQKGQHFSLKPDEKKLIDTAIENYLFSLPEEQRISQIFLVNIDGNTFYQPVEDSSKIDSLTQSNHAPLVPGGVLLFSYNIAGTAEDTIDFISSISAWCEKNNVCRPYIAVDQEGGYVARLKKITSPLPSNENVAKNFSAGQAYELYSLQARQMRALGIDMNLAPVIESENENNKDFLDTRSYGSIASSVSYSIAAVKAYQDNGIGAVLKHFPGNTNTDPHSGLPEIKISEAEILKKMILPFFLILQSSPSAVLMSHAKVNSFDFQNPASLSRIWVTENLKKNLSYSGLILSDDIFMGALANNGFPPDTAAIKTIEAGAHVIMMSDKRFSSVAKDLLLHARDNPDFQEKLTQAEKKVLEFKIWCGILNLKKKSDGTYVIENVSDLKQNGKKENRVKFFYENYDSGKKILQH